MCRSLRFIPRCFLCPLSDRLHGVSCTVLPRGLAHRPLGVLGWPRNEMGQQDVKYITRGTNHGIGVLWGCSVASRRAPGKDKASVYCGDPGQAIGNHKTHPEVFIYPRMVRQKRKRRTTPRHKSGVSAAGERATS